MKLFRLCQALCLRGKVLNTPISKVLTFHFLQGPSAELFHTLLWLWSCDSLVISHRWSSYK